MSLRVKHLNADASFFLVFSPPGAPSTSQGHFPGSFTILIDPWLTGPSITWAKSFAHTTHTVPASISSLSQLPEPDVVLCSQDKDDHCHQATLCQLPPDAKTTLLGPAAAVKKIRSWRHFDPSAVQALPRYDAQRPDETVYRIIIPPFSPSGSAGEVTISLMMPKVDVTGLHNAIGITYRPPSSILSPSSSMSYFDLPLTPPASPLQAAVLSPSYSRPKTPVRPKTPSISSTGSIPGLVRPKEKTLSLIYSPHGLPYAPNIKSYAMSHLLPMAGALPLTVLIHCFDLIDNPWYLGGNICSGSPGGLQIAKGLQARAWISAHDEEKESTGISVRQTKTKKYDRSDVERALRDYENRPTTPGDGLHEMKKKREGVQTAVVDLDAGEDFFVCAK